MTDRLTKLLIELKEVKEQNALQPNNSELQEQVILISKEIEDLTGMKVHDLGIDV